MKMLMTIAGLCIVNQSVSLLEPNTQRCSYSGFRAGIVHFMFVASGPKQNPRAPKKTEGPVPFSAGFTTTKATCVRSITVGERNASPVRINAAKDKAGAR